MKKIRNPYRLLDKHLCFGCSDKNPFGLSLDFELDGEVVKSSWKPDAHYQGFYQVLHGGIQATLLDEVAGWVVQVVCKTSGVTSGIVVSYHKPLYTTESIIFMEAKIKELRGKFVDIEAVLMNSDGVACSTALVTYYLYPEHTARERLYYPGVEAFFD